MAMWWWGEGDEPEVYHGPHSSREAALADAEGNAEAGSTVTLCTAQHVPLQDDIFTADEIMEKFEDYNEQCWGEDGPNASLTLPPGAVKELESMINGAWKQWREKYEAYKPYNLEKFENIEVILL